MAELIAEVDTGKGNRIITCHADSDKTWFIEEVRLMLWLKASNLNTDYHSAMNAEHFTKWTANDLINLELKKYIHF